MIFAVLLMVAGSALVSAPARFEKVSDHVYYMQPAGDGGNVGAVITDEGALLIDTQSDTDVSGILEALKRIKSKPVRWIVNTHEHDDHTGGNAHFAEHKAAIIGSRPPRDLTGREAAKIIAPQFSFGRQMRLFPGNIEVRILAVERAHTSRDLIILVPSEKILFVGDLFSAGSYPLIDTTPGEGSALGWLDAMRQTIEAMPLLKSAMPPPKGMAPKQPTEEKTLEESVIVIPGHGPVSNLQQMKDLLEMAQKLRAEAARAIASGRNRDSFVASPALTPFRVYRNFESYAAQLYDALAKK